MLIQFQRTIEISSLRTIRTAVLFAVCPAEVYRMRKSGKEKMSCTGELNRELCT